MAKPKEWTIMFYFASDNPLAPIIVSQLKAITSAGFHDDVNVICQFDPHTKGTDTHVFDVNGVSKLIYRRNRYKFWGKNDPYIRNLVFDKLWNEDVKFLNGKGIRESIQGVLNDLYGIRNYDPPKPGTMTEDNQKEVGDKTALHAEGDSEELSPKDSLEGFLNFCGEHYPAKHYMLFILGHGLVVGNDVFLSDEHSSENSLSLINLGKVLTNFTKLPQGRKLDLIGFHSCSMSAIEVAYELKDTATYLLASQGPAFVGSWPYREILFRVFNDLINKQNPKKRSPPIRRTMEKIFEYVLRYSYDFQLAGYSFDLSLCDLRQIDQVTDPLSDLVNSLKVSFTSSGESLVREAILLAHWDAQSFWQESYTDLFDFCSCLKRRCQVISNSSPKAAAYLRPIATKCRRVLAVLEKDIRKLSASERNKANKNRLIVRAAFAGPQYQYSHGLSVYFPWSEPTKRLFWNTEYKEKYAFAKTAWHEFLQIYFDLTQRPPVESEIPKALRRAPTMQERILEEITRKVFNVDGPLNTLEGGKGGPGGGLGPGDQGGKGGPGGGLSKGGPGGGTGGDCDCPSIKNYPTFTRDRSGQVPGKRRAKSGSEELFGVLVPTKRRSLS